LKAKNASTAKSPRTKTTAIARIHQLQPGSGRFAVAALLVVVCNPVERFKGVARVETSTLVQVALVKAQGLAVPLQFPLLRRQPEVVLNGLVWFKLV
jgi:hypothetical protein